MTQPFIDSMTKRGRVHCGKRTMGVAQTGFDGLRVLVVEDNDVVALDLSETLDALGCVVLGPTSSVQDSLALLRRCRPDIVMLDAQLEDGPAVPVAEALKAADIPFILTTGAGSAELDDALSGAPLLAKPYSMDAIEGALQSTCGIASGAVARPSGGASH
jgi:CheY-like chemotaxis protein